MTPISFSPSVNIIRDKDKSLHYIPTSNSHRIYDQIIHNYSTTSTRSFNIIGSYGTGKSAFLIAFEKQLKGSKIFGKLNGAFKGIKDFEFLNIIGEYSSIIETFAKKLKVRGKYNADDLMNHINAYYNIQHKKSKGVIIVIDEFGKHLEYAAGNNPEREMYFIQLLSEYVNDSKKNIILITTLHQNIDAYGAALDHTQRQEWNKVRGRLKELPFNEPVEQLLVLAADHISKIKYRDRVDKNFDRILKCIKEARLFPFRTDLSDEFAKKLYPLDILSASILTLALQKYGQNERSLFSFLLTRDYMGINDYDFSLNNYYHLSAVYDYLLNNYYSFLFTKYNPHYTQWAAIRTAIERVEGIYEKDIVNICKLLKVIGLLNIFSPESSSIDKTFLKTYGKYALEIKNIEEIIDDLENRKIIKYTLYKKKYILFEGSDLDIELALKEASEKVEKPVDILTPLKKYFDFPYISAKRIHYQKGTPRFFEFRLTDSPILKGPRGKIDGIINLIFASDPKGVKNLLHKNNTNEAILYGIYSNREKIRDNLWEINKIQFIIDNTHDDLVAKKELKNLLSYQIDLLNNKILDSIYSDDSLVTWIFNGENKIITNQTELNSTLSAIVSEIYNKTPTFKNELINRDRLPSNITVARRNFFKSLVEHWNCDDLGYSKDKYPPEKMIYLTLLKNTGIHRKHDGDYVLKEPKKSSDFLYLWDASIQFLKSATNRRRSLSDFSDILTSKPLYLKRGFIEFWIPIFMFIKKDDYALFFEDKYIPFINDELMELFIKSPKKIEIKTFNIQGTRLELFHSYQALLKRDKTNISNKSFVDTIKPFLIFYKSLPEYTKNTKNLNPHTRKVREAIAKSIDPEKTFFEDLPKALGYLNLDLQNDEEILHGYIDRLQDSINEIKLSFDNLVNEIDESINSILGYSLLNYSELMEIIHNRYKTLKEYKLAEHQKSFYKRLITIYPSKTDWLSSIIHSVMGKTLINLADEEVPLVKERLKDIIIELDDSCEMSEDLNDDNFEKVSKITINSLGDKSKSKIIRISKTKQGEINTYKQKLNELLSSNHETNIEILVTLLEDELQK